MAFVTGMLLCSITASAIPPQYQYTVEDLGWFGGVVMIPTAINSNGDVVGYGALPGGDQHAFVFAGGVLTDLGSFGQTQSWGVDVNDSGTVLGQAGPSTVNTTFTVTNGVTTMLPSTFSSVAGINNGGTIAGSTSILGTDHAVIFDGTTFIPLEHTSYSSVSVAINTSGQVAGTTYVSNGGPIQGFVYSSGTFNLLGTLGGSGTSVYGMNDLGQIVGTSQVSSTDWHPFVYSGGSLLDIGTSGIAYGINNSGQIVGAAANTPGSAFLYAGGNTTWLDAVTDYGATSFVSLDDARAINDIGQITGFGTTDTGEMHAFLLTPLSLTPVPEPQTWGAIAAATLASLALWRRARPGRSVRLDPTRQTP